MVDITQCEVCGRTIPAIGQECPFCARERPAPSGFERPYLPLALKLLLYLFLADVASTMGLGVLTVLNNRDGSLLSGAIVVASLLRILIGGATLVAFFFRQPVARTLSLLFLAFEAVGAGAVLLGWIPLQRWWGGLAAPLWNILFLFLLLRTDVKAFLDPRVFDHQSLSRLLRSVERGEHR